MDRNSIDTVAREIASHSDVQSIVLIGSAARNVMTAQSDIDLLVLGEKRPAVMNRYNGFHIQSKSNSELLRNIEAGEDFDAWCIRFGVPLYDQGLWRTLVENPAAKRWPKYQLKVLHGARRLFLAAELRRMGDVDASAEETLYVLGHVARGLLLRARVFPLSRPELAKQIADLGYPKIAELHERLRAQNTNERMLHLAQIYAKRLLVSLDKKTYSTCSQRFTTSRRAKVKKHAGT